MMRVALLVLAVSLTIPLYCFGWTGQVVRVEKGCALVIATEGGRLERIRLHGIVPPEHGHPVETLAIRFLRVLAQGARVEIREAAKGSAVVEIARSRGLCLNKELVRCGYSRVVRPQCLRPECMDWRWLELEAQEKRLGMWEEGEW